MIKADRRGSPWGASRLFYVVFTVLTPANHWNVRFTYVPMAQIIDGVRLFRNRRKRWREGEFNLPRCFTLG